MEDSSRFIVVENVWKAFGNNGPVLQNISMSIEKGKFVCLFGANGCGKTTFLSLLAGTDTDYEGRISICGRPPRQARVGIVPQHCEDALLPWRTLRDNIALGIELGGLKRHEREQRVRDFVSKANISLPLGLYPYQVSGGQQQLTVILQALIQQPDFLVLDEPFSALDPEHMNVVQNTLVQLWMLAHTTIIFTTHDLLNAIHFADQVVMFGAKPANVIMQFDIPLPRPRSRRDPKILELIDQAHHTYLSQGLDN
jgi:NitT/TauT family transport system ATP-binding protein